MELRVNNAEGVCDNLKAKGAGSWLAFYSDELDVIVAESC
jgi:hypothetical protein